MASGADPSHAPKQPAAQHCGILSDHKAPISSICLLHREPVLREALLHPGPVVHPRHLGRGRDRDSQRCRIKPAGNGHGGDIHRHEWISTDPVSSLNSCNVANHVI